MVETVGDLDNVLWEISNESDPGSVEWQYEMIRTIKKLELTWATLTPSEMTALWPFGAMPYSSGAQLIGSLPITTRKNEAYRKDPPATTGEKMILSDTDHVWGIASNTDWVWKSTLRRLNVLFMDPYEIEMRLRLTQFRLLPRKKTVRLHYLPLLNRKVSARRWDMHAL